MGARLSIIFVLLIFGQAVHANSESMIFEGSYKFRTDSESMEVLGSQICFYPSNKNSKPVTRPSNDLRLEWFCFSNSQEAANLLGVNLEAQQGCGVEGEARIKVINYERYTGEGCGSDTATLLTVLQKSDLKMIPCGH